MWLPAVKSEGASACSIPEELRIQKEKFRRFPVLLPSLLLCLKLPPRSRGSAVIGLAATAALSVLRNTDAGVCLGIAEVRSSGCRASVFPVPLLQSLSSADTCF